VPVFEYKCATCGGRFERLMFSTTSSVACPDCGSAEVEKLPSTFGMSGVERQTTSTGACASCSSGSCSSCGH
jgi:putative FmdB family regulatory protein